MTSPLKVSELMQKLERRGILDAAIAAGWHEYRWIDTMGWAYPLYQANGDKWILPKEAGVAAGRPAQRWKAFDSAHNPKFAWGYSEQSSNKEPKDLRQPVGCAYYWLPGGDIKDAVAAHDGNIIVACGEPDTLTFATAGYRNVTSFFGEGIIPHNIVEVFQKLGVRSVTYYPDNDNTGWDDAQKLIETFEGTGIVVTVLALMDEVAGHEINDVNDLWIASEFDTEAFNGMLKMCAPLNEVLKAVGAQPDDISNEQAWQEYHEAIEQKLGAQWKRGRGWSNYMPCIFANHDNDDRSPKATYHKEKHTYRCFKCAETWKGDQVADRLGIERPKYPQQQALTAHKNGSTPASPPPTIPIYSSDDSLARYKERLLGVNTVEHLPFPFTALHKYGGFCRVIPLGKVIGILGLSGGGKTSFIETLTDAWRRIGFNVMWWGPEWTWEEMADRAIQRYGGLSIIEMMLHELWMNEEQRGIPIENRLGEKQPQTKVDKSNEIADAIMSWQGKAFYLDKMDVTLPQLLEAAQTKIDELARDNRKPKIAVFDYIQLAEISGARSDGERIPRAVSHIKAFCTDNRLVGVVGTQTRKDDSEEAREDGKLLTAEAAQYFRDDKTNLFLTLNPEFDEEGNMTGEGWINIVKNSGGKKGKLQAKPDPRYLRWNDTKTVDISKL